jgi:hypothetical protein
MYNDDHNKEIDITLNNKDTYDLENLLGHAEVCEMLNWESRKLTRYIKLNMFPEPIIRLKSTPIWSTNQIEAYIQKK